MALKSDLMASSLPYEAAGKIGQDPVTAITAAGTTQTGATSLNCNCANVTTSTIGGGVLITEPIGRNFVYNAGPNTLTVYPPVGQNFVGLANNVGIQVASASSVMAEGNGTSLIWNIGI